MLLIKMLNICLLLKDLDLFKFFSNGKCDYEAMVKSLPHDITERLCKIASCKDPVNEVDAIAGIADFFLSLIEQVKTSPNCLNLIDRLPIPAEAKKAILNLLGKT